MGYSTYYEIEASEPVHAWDFPYEGECTHLSVTKDYIAEASWYEHEEDMRALSEEHPSVTFTLYGSGEEQGDKWIKHFRDGKMKHRKATLVMPEESEVEWT